MDHPFAMLLEGCRNIELSAETGAEFIMMDRMLIPLIISASENITLRGFSIDFASELYVQTTVYDAGPDFFELELETPCNVQVADGHLLLNGELFFGAAEIDPETHGLRRGTALNFREDYPAEIPVSITPGKRIRFEGKLHQMPGKDVRMVLRCGKRTTPALFLEKSKCIQVEDVSIYQAPGMGLIAQTCADLTVRKFRTQIAPGKKRSWSVCADALHFVNCCGSLLIEECQLEHQYDDSVNIHGIYSIAERMLSSGEYLLKRCHHAQAGVPVAIPGNKFRAVDPKTLAARCEFTAETVEEADAFHTCLRPFPPNAIPIGSALENLDWRFSDVVIRNNIMRHNNPRGILVSSGEHVLIENNLIDVPYAAVYISGDASDWYESGFVGEVIIRNNTINACYGGEPSMICAAVQVLPVTSGANTVYHGKIIIQGNHFLNHNIPIAFVRNTEVLEIIS